MMNDFPYSDLLPLGEDQSKYRLISTEGVTTFTANGKEFLEVSPSALEKLTQEAIHDISHYLRSEHLAQLKKIIDINQKDPPSEGLNTLMINFM